MTKPSQPSPPRLGERLAAPGYDITFRFQEADHLTDAEERALIELLRTAFNGGPSWFGLVADPIDHLHWKFRDFPGTAQAEFLELGERVVGMIYGMRRRFLVHGHELVGRDAVDLALDPSIQGRGVQTLRTVDMLPIRLQMFPEVAFNWSLTTHPTAQHLRERTRTQTIGNYLETHLKLLSIRGLLRRPRRAKQSEGISRTRTMLESRQRRLVQIGDRARLGLRLAVASGRARIRPPARGDAEITTIDRFGPEFDDLGATAATAFDFIQVRDAEYLNWRFCDARGGVFVVRAAWDGERILGYSATRIDRDEAVLSDLLTLPDRPDVVAALVEDATEVARAAGAPVIRSWLPRHHPYRDALHHSGFISSPAVVSLGYQMWWGEAETMAFLDNPRARVHVMNADSDHL